MGHIVDLTHNPSPDTNPSQAQSTTSWKGPERWWARRPKCSRPRSQRCSVSRRAIRPRTRHMDTKRTPWRWKYTNGERAISGSQWEPYSCNPAPCPPCRRCPRLQASQAARSQSQPPATTSQSETSSRRSRALFLPVVVRFALLHICCGEFCPLWPLSIQRWSAVHCALHVLLLLARVMRGGCIYESCGPERRSIGYM